MNYLEARIRNKVSPGTERGFVSPITEAFTLSAGSRLQRQLH